MDLQEIVERQVRRQRARGEQEREGPRLPAAAHHRGAEETDRRGRPPEQDSEVREQARPRPQPRHGGHVLGQRAHVDHAGHREHRNHAEDGQGREEDRSQPAGRDGMHGLEAPAARAGAS